MANEASNRPDELAELRARLEVAEQRLRRQEQYTDWILRASLEGFHLVGMNGEILDCNESFAALVGYHRSDLLHRSIATLDRRPPDELAALITEVVRRGALRFLAQHHHRDGRPMDVEISAHLADIDGERVFVCFSHPIGEQLARERALQASEAKLRAVFERTAMLIALLSPDGVLLEHNLRLAGIAGPIDQAAVGSAFWDMSFWSRDSDRRAVEACVRAAAAGTIRACEVELHAVDGRLVVVALQVGPLLDADGRCIQLLAEGYEVTDLRRAEAEREAAQRRLLTSQEETIRELSTPLIPLEDGVLVVPLVGRIDRVRAATLLERLLAGVVARRATVAILDITGISVVDAEVAASLIQTARAIKLLGARAILTGVQPAVAAHLVDLDIDLEGLVVVDSLQSALARVRARR